MKKVSPHAISGDPASLDPMSASTPANSEAIKRRIDSSIISYRPHPALSPAVRERDYLRLPGNAVALSAIGGPGRGASLSSAGPRGVTNDRGCSGERKTG